MIYRVWEGEENHITWNGENGSKRIRRSGRNVANWGGGILGLS